MVDVVNIKQGRLEAQTQNGQLVSVVSHGTEYFHGGGKDESLKTDKDRRGWPHSEIVMFPVVGPVKRYRFRFQGEDYLLDQHGVSRYLPWELKDNEENKVVLAQRYTEGVRVRNPKHVQGGDRPEYLDWPFGFFLRKTIEIVDKSLKVSLRVRNPKYRSVLPCMIGWHPSFRFLDGSSNLVFMANGKTYSLDDVVEASQNGALELPETRRVVCRYESDGHGITFASPHMRHLMIWCPGEESGMFCIEPVTHLPGSLNGKDFLSGIMQENAREKVKRIIHFL